MSTAIAKPNINGAIAERPSTLKGWLQSDAFKGEVAKALPKHCDPDRLLRVAITALTRTPKLAECEHASFLRCMLDLSQWGLEPDGRHAHLIPFNNRKRNVVECQLILDYKGIVQLLYRSNRVSTIYAEVVYEGDVFDYSMGILRDHKPWFLRSDSGKPDSRGKMIAAVCRVVFKDGTARSEVMSKEEVDGIRARSKAKNSGPWVTDYDEMAKKTVFRRASKWLPISAEMVDAMERDFDSPDFRNEKRIIDAQASPRLSLDDLAGQLECQGDESEDDEEPADPVSIALERIAAATTPIEVAALDDEYLGPDSPLSLEQSKEVSAAINARRDALRAAAAEPGEAVGPDGELFDATGGEGVGQ